MISIERLIAAGIAPTQARQFVLPLNATCTQFGISTPARQAAFIAQCAHESGRFTTLEESMFYRDPVRVAQLFRTAFDLNKNGRVDQAEIEFAKGYVMNSKALANRAYADRNGNGDEASGDGFRFRGRGLIQLTGRNNYHDCGLEVGRPYVTDPDLLLKPDDACVSAAWFWTINHLSVLADAHAIDAITKAVNGPAMVGAAERRELFEHGLTAFA